MIFPENQVRNFYVVKGNTVPTEPTKSDAGNAEAFIKNGNFYVKYVDANGKIITTDRINVDSIRDIRISNPEGFTARTWTATMIMPSGVANGDTFMLYLELGNVFNFGEGERFFYSYPIVKTSSITTAAQLATAFADMLAKVLKYNKVMASVFESVTANGADLVFTEAAQDFNTILRFYPHKVKVNITSAAVHADGTTEDYISSIVEGTNTTNSRNNGYKIAAMENYFSRVRADLYGYNGFPDINPSTMITNDADDNTYYILDIKYYRQLHGINVQKSEKEMSFAATEISTLFNLLKTEDNSIVVESSALDAPDVNNTSIYTPVTKPTVVSQATETTETTETTEP